MSTLNIEKQFKGRLVEYLFYMLYLQNALKHICFKIIANKGIQKNENKMKKCRLIKQDGESNFLK